jgi:predicted histone-like DNA-binding protein
VEVRVNLRKNTNEKSDQFGKYYPRIDRKRTLSLRGLAKHISDHGSIYTRDVVLGVLSKFTSCLTELVAQGVAVKLDGLGTFYPTLEAKGAETPVGYNIQEYLKGIHVRFQPEGCDDDNITSREMKKKVIMQQNMIFDLNGVPKKVKDGQLVDYGADDDEDNDDNTNNNEG